MSALGQKAQDFMCWLTSLFIAFGTTLGPLLLGGALLFPKTFRTTTKQPASKITRILQTLTAAGMALVGGVIAFKFGLADPWECKLVARSSYMFGWAQIVAGFNCVIMGVALILLQVRSEFQAIKNGRGQKER